MPELYFIDNEIYFLFETGREYWLSDPSQVRERHFGEPSLNQKNYENVSEWVAHLLTKGWCTHGQLISVAELIYKYFPNPKINWFNTWMLVEEKRKM